MTKHFNETFNQEPKGATLCWRSEPSLSTMLHQRGKDSFVVTYGKQVDDRLTYGEACAKLGEALIHALACDSLLDNRMKGER